MAVQQQQCVSSNVGAGCLRDMWPTYRILCKMNQVLSEMLPVATRCPTIGQGR